MKPDRLPTITTATFRGRGAAEVFPGWRLARTVRATGGPFQNLPDPGAALPLLVPFRCVPTLVSYPDPTVLTGPDAMWGLYVEEEVFEVVTLVGTAFQRTRTGDPGRETALGLVWVELLGRAGIPPERLATMAKLLGAGKPGADRSWWTDLVESLPARERDRLESPHLQAEELLRYLETGTLRGTPR